MNINGMLVHASPDSLADVRRDLSALAGVEIHRESDDGRLIVTVEDVDGNDPGDVILEIDRMRGVLSTALVFHHKDDEDGANAPAA